MNYYKTTSNGTTLGHFIWINTNLLTLDLTTQNAITIIGSKSFANDTNLQKIVLPKELKMIEEYAFEKCSELQIVQFLKTVEDVEIEKQKEFIEEKGNETLTLQYRCFKD